MADPVMVAMPLQLPSDMLRAVRKDPLTACEDKDQENARIGWLLFAWDVMVEFQQRAAGVKELPEGRNSQHVLKAEGASPDATARENCANASPDGGPMGAGQAAAAAPAGERAFEIWPNSYAAGAPERRLG